MPKNTKGEVIPKASNLDIWLHSLFKATLREQWASCSVGKDGVVTLETPKAEAIKAANYEIPTNTNTVILSAAERLKTGSVESLGTQKQVPIYKSTPNCQIELR